MLFERRKKILTSPTKTKKTNQIIVLRLYTYIFFSCFILHDHNVNMYLHIVIVEYVFSFFKVSNYGRRRGTHQATTSR